MLLSICPFVHARDAGFRRWKESFGRKDALAVVDDERQSNCHGKRLVRRHCNDELEIFYHAS